MKRLAIAFCLAAISLAAITLADSTTKPTTDSTTRPAPTANATVRWGERVDGCRLGVSYVPDAIGPGDSLDLMVSVENGGKNNVWLDVRFGDNVAFGDETPRFWTKGKGPDLRDIEHTLAFASGGSDPGIRGSHFELASGKTKRWSYRATRDWLFIDSGTYTAKIHLAFFALDSTGTAIASTQPSILSSPEFTVQVLSGRIK